MQDGADELKQLNPMQRSLFRFRCLKFAPDTHALISSGRRARGRSKSGNVASCRQAAVYALDRSPNHYYYIPTRCKKVI